MQQLNPRQRSIWIGLVLSALTLAAFWPVLHNDFIKYDDRQYVLENPHVLTGLTWDNVKWAFQPGYASNWHPLTWMSHMLDVQLFGLRPGWHHFVNLVLHIGNTVLLFVVLQRMTGATWRSAFVAALFGVHPLHVESVAWVAERKDVLSTFFFMLTLWAYERYARSVTSPGSTHTIRAIGRRTFYGLTLLFFILGLMSKPMLVTVPFVLLLLDFWPLRRVNFAGPAQITAKAPDTARRPRDGILLLMLEKIPLFALCAASSMVTFLAQQKGHSISTVEGLPVTARSINTVASYWKYLAKTVWPTGLTIFYPHPATHGEQWSNGAIMVAVAGLAAISLFALIRIKRQPWLAIGWFWYLGTLVPVIGLIQVGSQAIADRYTYIPLIGIFICGTWSATEFFSRRRLVPVPLAVAGVAIVIACSGAARNQVNYWRDDFVLFSHALEITTNNAVAHTILGEVAAEQGELAAAEEHLHAAITADPNYSSAHYDLAIVFAKQALALAREGKLAEAVEKYRESLHSHPLAPAHNSLGAVLWQLGRSEEALGEYNEALRLEPDLADAHYNLGAALAASGKIDEAGSHFAEAVRLKPDHARALSSLGRILAMQGRGEEARSRFVDSLRIEPNDPETRLNFAMYLSAMKRPGESIVEYRKVLQLNDQIAIAWNNLAWILAADSDSGIRNGKEAVEAAEHACKLTNNEQPFFIGTLAAAYAEAGRFDEAVAAAEKARALAQQKGLDDLVKWNEQLLELYRAGKPYHEPAAP